MTTKKPKTGGEIDSYCTKCKLDLTHRIIAMVGDEVKKVECKTCGSHHLYRRPKSEKLLPSSSKGKVVATKRDAGEEREKRPASAKAAAAAQREREQTSQ